MRKVAWNVKPSIMSENGCEIMFFNLALIGPDGVGKPFGVYAKTDGTFDREKMLEGITALIEQTVEQITKDEADVKA